MEHSNTDTKSHPVQESEQNDPTLDSESDDASQTSEHDDASQTSEQDDPWGMTPVTRPNSTNL